MSTATSILIPGRKRPLEVSAFSNPTKSRSKLPRRARAPLLPIVDLVSGHSCLARSGGGGRVLLHLLPEQPLPSIQSDWELRRGCFAERVLQDHPIVLSEDQEWRERKRSEAINCGGEQEPVCSRD
ncbi:cyclin-SDS-like [Canna indica]|uniref:Cyclin-SDS-like n=1 Tax=Canna indica TaxID=4628 RepID=A0AAQ3QNF7_9LILI|nr:cyclin-SDS-like [Canna indica]